MTSRTESEYQQLTLAQLLKEKRGQRGLTIAQLSRQAGLAVGQIHKLENDQVKKVNPAHLAALAGPLDLPVHRLFELAGYPVERVPFLEPELSRRLAELPPPALEQIQAMLTDWLAGVEGPRQAPVPEPVGIDDPSADDSNRSS